MYLHFLFHSSWLLSTTWDRKLEDHVFSYFILKLCHLLIQERFNKAAALSHYILGFHENFSQIWMLSCNFISIKKIVELQPSSSCCSAVSFRSKIQSMQNRISWLILRNSLRYANMLLSVLVTLRKTADAKISHISTALKWSHAAAFCVWMNRKTWFTIWIWRNCVQYVWVSNCDIFLFPSSCAMISPALFCGIFQLWL